MGVTWNKDMSWVVWVWFPDLWPTQIPVQWLMLFLFTGVNDLWSEADRSLSSSAEGKNEWNCSFFPAVRDLHRLRMDFVFTLNQKFDYCIHNRQQSDTALSQLNPSP
jgi:hypothetical protein